MFRIRLKLTLLVALGLCLFSPGAEINFAFAQKPKPAPESADSVKKPSTDVFGQVNEVDAKKGRLSLTVPPKVKGEPGEDLILELAKDVKVLIDEGKSLKPGSYRAGTLADVKAGQSITVEMSADKKTGVAIRLQGQMAGGALKSVDAAKHALTLTSRKKPEGEQDTIIALSKDARIYLEGKEIKLAELVPDLVISVRLSGDLKEAGVVQAQWPIVQGVLRSIDAGKSTVSLATPTKFDADAETAYPVAKDAKILIYGREARLKDLVKDTPVALKLVGARKEVGVIEAQGPSVRGILKNVDAANLTVTVLVPKSKTQPPEEKTFTLLKEVPIEIAAGKLGKLADLNKDQPITLWLSLDQKTVASISAAKKPTK